MTSRPFVSFAQNREDVVLHRAFSHLDSGSYIDVGAGHPADDSSSRSFYDRGWRGITVEPVPVFAELHRTQRAEDLMIEAAVAEADGGTAVLHRSDRLAGSDLTVATRSLNSILAEAGWQDRAIDFMTVDTEGTESTVLRSVDLRRWRPKVIVVAATSPTGTGSTHDQWESLLLDAEYRFCLYDGLSRFYVAAEHEADLGPALSFPACVRDSFQIADASPLLGEPADAQQAALAALAAERDAARAGQDQALEDLVRWRAKALQGWPGGDARSAAAEPGELEHLRRSTHDLSVELEAVRNTLSWRVTKPIRLVRSAVAKIGRR